MLLLGIDLETTSLDIARNEIIEIGAALWDTETEKPVALLSELIYTKSEISQEITEITGITTSDIRNWGKPLGEVLQRLMPLFEKCDYIIAHNGRNFDKIVLDRHLQAFPEIKYTAEWIDTMTDVPFSNHIKTRKLSYLAAEHGFINPFSHRALFDVLTMLQLVVKYDIAEIVELQKSPLVRVVAEVTFDERDKARESGFRWDRNEKQWFIEVKQVQLAKMSFPFQISMELS